MSHRAWYFNATVCAVLAVLSMLVWHNGDGATWIVGVLVCAKGLRRKAVIGGNGMSAVHRDNPDASTDEMNALYVAALMEFRERTAPQRHDPPAVRRRRDATSEPDDATTAAPRRKSEP